MVIFITLISSSPSLLFLLLLLFASTTIPPTQRNPANQALWITSKTNTEFFSASTSGTIKWWDIRNLRQPSEELVMDLDDPLRADVVRAIGVTTLQFEPTMGSRFLVGTVNGTVINVNRKAMSTIEKLGTRFNCHVGPVIAIDRNPFIPKNFLTVGDWTVKIWADDTKESSLISIRLETLDSLLFFCKWRKKNVCFDNFDSMKKYQISNQYKHSLF